MMCERENIGIGVDDFDCDDLTELSNCRSALLALTIRSLKRLLSNVDFDLHTCWKC